MLTRFIDFLQYSAFYSEQCCFEDGFVMIDPLRYYKRGYKDPLGRRLYFGNPKTDKALFIDDGRTLARKRSCGITDSIILDEAFSQGAKISRLDLTITEWIEEDLIILPDVEHWVAKDLVDSPLVKHGARKVEALNIDYQNVVETLYIGSLKKRGKLGIFRAYDKGIELNLSEYLCTRLELEERGKNADTSAKRLALTGNFSGVFRSRFNVRSKDFERLLDSEALDISRGTAKLNEDDHDSNDRRWVWLMKQVAPALKKAIGFDSEHGLGTQRIQQFKAISGIE